MNRKEFLKMGTALVAASPFRPDVSYKTKQTAVKKVDFVHDGLELSPKEYAALLMKLADENKIKADYYSNDGIVAELEQKFATLLGQEAAVFMPTGTLANHIAVRKLSGDRRRVIVQELSHMYNDAGDGCTVLSNLNLIPLGQGQVEIKPEEVDYLIKKTNTGRVALHIGALSIETPVRRLQDRMYEDTNLDAILQIARNHGIKTHLDGARIFVQAAHTHVMPDVYGKKFDTVYTSLWKCFNAPSGAILGCSKSFAEGLYHERRMFGGSLPAAWPYAAVALHYADDFIPAYKKAWATSETLIQTLQKDERITCTNFEHGSHIIKLNLQAIDGSKLKSALSKRKVEINEPMGKSVLLKINPSINVISVEELIGRWQEALRDM